MSSSSLILAAIAVSLSDIAQLDGLVTQGMDAIAAVFGVGGLNDKFDATDGVDKVCVRGRGGKGGGEATGGGREGGGEGDG